MDVSKISLRTTVLGYPTSCPIYVTATALGKLAHPEGEVRVASPCVKQRGHARHDLHGTSIEDKGEEREIDREIAHMRGAYPRKRQL